MLGSPRCEVCSNSFLALLLPFAAAGIALVVFLSLLKLTVATGMINSVILYANIVQVNRTVFFSRSDKNALTIFVAWLNLDLGFESCFYDGMTAYAQTWLQFAFPMYVWILISLIILISRHSVTASKLIGHNPIAVLATLILMSYTKVLKIITAVYSSVVLDYPANRTVTVWLQDANVPYMQSWHLLLVVVTTLVLVLFFLPYTLLLLLGHKLYRFSGKKYMGWFRKLKPLLDSYYAPYRIHTRFWTGFLLLVRCILYVVFSFNSLGATTLSLLAIVVTFTGIGFTAGFLLNGRLYRQTCVNFIEASIYLNLIALSGVSLTKYNSTALLYSMIGVVFVTMLTIIVFHLHLSYTAKSVMWRRIKTKISSVAAMMTVRKSECTSEQDHAATSSQDPHRIVTKTVIELREPLLEISN